MSVKTHKDVLGLIYEIKKEVPSFKIVEKTGWFWTCLGALVYVVTLGKNKYFNYAYITTLANFVCVPTKWLDEASPDEVYSVLVHEFMHLKQIKRYGLGNFWLGILPFATMYLFLPIPIGLAYGRYVLEREAYTESIRFDYESYGEDAAKLTVKQSTEQLTGGMYGFAWPFPKQVKSYFDSQLEKIKLGLI